MATVTGFTAARMLAIENSTVTGGFINLSGDLILSKRDGSTINAGHAVGPQGAMQYLSVTDDPTLDLTLSGDGTSVNPWVLSGKSKQFLQVADDATLDLTLTGTGTQADPFVISGKSILPNRLGLYGNTITDWNNAVGPGFYEGVAASNAPTFDSGGTWAVGVVLSQGGSTNNRVTQLVMDYTAAEGASDIWKRSRSGATWTSWIRVTPKSSTIDATYTPLTGYLSAGITYVADSDPIATPGIAARRVGKDVELYLYNFQIASLDIPTNGNIANMNILDAIPTRFRPKRRAGISSGPAGRLWGGIVHENGDVIMASTVPTATQTATDNFTSQTFSGYAYYPAADST